MARNGPADEIVIALVGQPNCGKSTIFNAVAGFRVNTANFPGTTVSFTETPVRFEGRTLRLIDLPGTYSISSHDLAEKVTRDYLLSGNVDVVVNVVDASMVSRSLELTIQLVEMGVPMVVALNMMDEAERKGIALDTGRFESLTGLRACPVVAVHGTGIPELFREAIRTAGGASVSGEEGAANRPLQPRYDRDVEECIAELQARYTSGLRQALAMDPRFVIIRLLEMDEEFERRAGEIDRGFVTFLRERRRALAEMHNWPEAGVFASHRHALVLDLFEKFATVTHRRRADLRERIDRFATNPVGGLLVVLSSFFLLFYVSFWLGDGIARLTGGPFAGLRETVKGLGAGVLPAMASGLVDGLEAGAGIVLPYLVPLLFLLALYEDTGFLPRIAFMVDGLLHRVGLHGKSVVPIVLGYGCNVPAIMATRNLESPRDRVLTMLVIPFITCSARTVVILALAGKFLGAAWTTAIFVGSTAIALAVSFALSRIQVHVSPGIIMDVPPLRRPYPAILVKKVWLRLHEFLAFGWPVLVVASLALSLLSLLGIDDAINWALSPLTELVLDLPRETGMPLFLGIFRKELALVMLSAALGTEDVSTVLTQQQILVLVVFTAIYIPCVAALAALVKEGGWKTCLGSAALNLVTALVVAGALAHVGL